jgi:hypothetical protein
MNTFTADSGQVFTDLVGQIELACDTREQALRCGCFWRKLALSGIYVGALTLASLTSGKYCGASRRSNMP